VIITTEPMHYPDADLQEASNQYDNASTLSDLHNLIAAARATLSAHADGEADALYYLRDELQAQGQLPPEYRGERGERP
jgi:hypothetical protein